MYFAYANGGPQGAHEQRVADGGYKWVRTNQLFPTREDRAIDFGRPDRLLTHSHHGWNTHLIVEGDLSIESHEEASRGRPHRRSEISTAPGAETESVVRPGLPYSGTTRRGCRFVEGHRNLSPRSAERFVDRGTLLAVFGGDVGDGYYPQPWGRLTAPGQARVREWLRGARFRPDGKAEPDLLRGEWPVLEYKQEPGSESERRAQLEIARWFEREWRDVAPPPVSPPAAGGQAGAGGLGGLFYIALLILSMAIAIWCSK